MNVTKYLSQKSEEDLQLIGDKKIYTYQKLSVLQDGVIQKQSRGNVKIELEDNSRTLTIFPKSDLELHFPDVNVKLPRLFYIAICIDLTIFLFIYCLFCFFLNLQFCFSFLFLSPKIINRHSSVLKFSLYLYVKKLL